MDQNKFITTTLNSIKENYDFILNDKSYYHTIYIFKFNKNMKLEKYKANAILGKRADGIPFVIHAKYHTSSSKLKEKLEYYERVNVNKALNATPEEIKMHGYEYSTKIDYLDMDESFKHSNCAVPMLEGYVYSDTVWYLDENHSLKDFVSYLLAKREADIKELQRRINISVEKYNSLSIIYDKLVGDNKNEGEENN